LANDQSSIAFTWHEERKLRRERVKQMTDEHDSDGERSNPDWLDAEMLLSDSLATYVEDRIEEAKSEGISLQALFSVLLMSIDQTFAKKAPEIDGPLLLMGMAVNRKAARGEVKVADKMREALKRILRE
jgi:hypothetical protein